jgi:hypothetical protein
MNLYVGSKDKSIWNVFCNVGQFCIVGVCLMGLSACKTLSTAPSGSQEINSPRQILEKSQPWTKKQPKLMQLFSSEEARSAAAIVELSHYFNRLHEMSPEALKNEISLTKNAYKKEPLPVIGLSLAYQYTIKLSLSNTKKSEKILVDLIKNNDVDESYRAFSQLLLHSMVAKSDQRRLFLKERRKNKTLKQQLEALKNIELKINERQPTAELAEPAL